MKWTWCAVMGHLSIVFRFICGARYTASKCARSQAFWFYFDDSMNVTLYLCMVLFFMWCACQQGNTSFQAFRASARMVIRVCLFLFPGALLQSYFVKVVRRSRYSLSAQGLPWGYVCAKWRWGVVKSSFARELSKCSVVSEFTENKFKRFVCLYARGV